MYKLSSRLAATTAPVASRAAACSKSGKPHATDDGRHRNYSGKARQQPHPSRCRVPCRLPPARSIRNCSISRSRWSVANAVITPVRPPRPTRFEVSTDSGFATKAYSKTGVAAGASGQTSLTIDKESRPARAIFWHARSRPTAAGRGGPFSAGSRVSTIRAGQSRIRLRPPS